MLFAHVSRCVPPLLHTFSNRCGPATIFPQLAARVVQKGNVNECDLGMMQADVMRRTVAVRVN